MTTNRSYGRQAVATYKKLSLVEAQHGRALHQLGLLLRRHKIADEEDCLSQARRIFSGIKGEELEVEKANPFQDLIHPYCW